MRYLLPALVLWTGSAVAEPVYLRCVSDGTSARSMTGLGVLIFEVDPEQRTLVELRNGKREPLGHMNVTETFLIHETSAEGLGKQRTVIDRFSLGFEITTTTQSETSRMRGQCTIATRL